VDAALAGGQKQKRGHGKAGAENNFRFWMHQFHLPGTRKRAPQSERTLTWALGDRCRNPPESNSEIVPGPRCPLFLAASEVQNAVILGQFVVDRLGKPVDGLLGDILQFNQSCLLRIPNFPNCIAILHHDTNPHALSAGAAEERELGSGGIGFEIGD